MANKFSNTTVAIRFNLLQVCPSVPPFSVVVVFISSFLCSEQLFCFIEFGGDSYRSNFEKFRDAAPLRAERTLIPPSLILLVVIVLF